MSVPALGRATLPPGPSRRVHHFTVITVLLVATVVASSQPKDLCRQDRSNFASQIHTIGSIDDALWAITKPDWNVYKLTPCSANDSLVHCMMVDSPVEVDTKWPKLVGAANSEAQSTDLSFSVDNSVVMDSSQFGNTVLVMKSASFIKTKYFGFVFGSNPPENARNAGDEISNSGLWISSDVKDKAYRLLDAGKQVDLVDIFKNQDSLYIEIKTASTKYICTDTNEGLGVQFKNQSECDPKMDGSVKTAVLYRKQFYFFTSNTVYIFSDQAETVSTKMLSVSLKDFFHCNEPTTMAPPSSASNATSPRASTNSTHISTTAKSSSTIIIIIVVVVIVLVVILALITAYFCWCRTKASKDGKSDGNAILGSSSPNDSKVSVKVQAVSKGALKQSQTKAKAVAPNTSLGKQSPKPKASSSARNLIKVDQSAIDRNIAERRQLARDLAEIGKKLGKAKESTVPYLPNF